MIEKRRNSNEGCLGYQCAVGNISNEVAIPFDMGQTVVGALSNSSQYRDFIIFGGMHENKGLILFPTLAFRFIQQDTF